MDPCDLYNYLLAMAIAHMLVNRKLLGMDEFFRFEKIIRKKYGLPINSIFRDEFVIRGGK